MSEQQVDSIYPIYSKDNLGRNVRTEWSPYNKTLFTYWGDTNSIKVIYRVYADDISFEAYNPAGETIMTYTLGSFEIKVKGFKIKKNGQVYFRPKRELVNSWSKLLKRK